MWTCCAPEEKDLLDAYCVPGIVLSTHCRGSHQLRPTLGSSFNCIDEERKASRGSGILPKVTEQVRLI